MTHPKEPALIVCNVARVLGRDSQAMTHEHQYSVGETVHYLSSPDNPYKTSGDYRILRLLPIEGADLQYRIRSTLESFDRIAAEWQLGVNSRQPGFQLS